MKMPTRGVDLDNTMQVDDYNAFRSKLNELGKEPQMKNILALIGLVVVVFAGAGWYLGWYKLESVAKSANGETNVSVKVDTSKIGDDAASFHERIADLMSKVEDKADDKADAAKTEASKPKVEEKKSTDNPFGVRLPNGK